MRKQYDFHVFTWDAFHTVSIKNHLPVCEYYRDWLNALCDNYLLNMHKKSFQLTNGEWAEELSEPDYRGVRSCIVIWSDREDGRPRATTAEFNKYGACVSHMMGWHIPPKMLGMDIAPTNGFIYGLLGEDA